MKILIMLAAAILCLNLEARHYHNSCGRPKTVSVRGYVTKRGIYVRPYRRAAPMHNGAIIFNKWKSKHTAYISLSGQYGSSSYNSNIENILVDMSKIDYSRRCSICCGSGKRYKSITGAKYIAAREVFACNTCQGTGFRLRK